MRRVVFNNYAVGSFVAAHAPCAYRPPWDCCVGVVDENGAPLGGVVITNYTGRSCSLHMAGVGGNWATRDFLWAVFHYCFEQLKCKRVFGLVSANDTKVLDIDTRLGFKPLYIIPDLFENGDGVLLSMTREDCRWLRHQPRSIKPGEADHGQDNPT